MDSREPDDRLVGGTDHRLLRRFYLGMSATLTVDNEAQAYPAFIRDWSWAGIFFYSGWMPGSADDVNITLLAKQVRLHCTGRVVRVQHGTAGNATGVALCLARCETVPVPAIQS
jgi:hypothetical protein